MVPVKASESRDVVDLLEHGWPGSFSTESAQIYLQALGDLPGPAVIATLQGLIAIEEFRPSVAAIRAAVQRMGLPSSEEALTQARKLMKWREQQRFVNGSGYNPPKPDVHEAVERALPSRVFGGWERTFLSAYGANPVPTSGEVRSIGP